MGAVKVIIGNSEISGYKSLTFNKEFGHIASSFHMTFPASNISQLTIGQPLTIQVNGFNVITGYIDYTRYDIADDNEVLIIKGRDKLGDLVDCAAPLLKFRDQTLSSIINSLCSDFGIKVIDEIGDLTIINKFEVEAGERVYSALQRLANLRFFFITGDGDGNVIIRREFKHSQHQLTLSRELEKLTITENNSQRFSEITAYGQGNIFSQERYNRKYVIEDSQITRYRPLIVISTASRSDNIPLQEFAEYSLRTRNGRAINISFDTPQISPNDNGEIWQVGELINLQNRSAINIPNIDNDFVIDSHSLFLDSKKLSSRLTLSPIGTYRLLTPQPKSLNANQ